MSTAAAEMVSVGGHRIALQGMHLRATLQDLLSEITVTQTYKNLEDVNIEAVYTFPLPLDAILLDLRVTLGRRELRGVVVEKREAEERYEEAITDGDTAIMLQQVEPGLYTMNVGNLQAGEQATVRFTYSMLHHWQNGTLRFMLPTTIAPRYGNPLVTGMQPHQTPEYSLEAGPGFSVRLSVAGVLRNARVSSPSHPVRVGSEGEMTVVDLVADNVAMDRDFVLNFEAERTFPSARWDRDIDGYVAMATFQPVLPEYTDPSPRSYKIVVDCSGSMGGDSIAQARDALRNISGSLRPQDYFNIIKFGSDYDRMFNEQRPASPENLQLAQRYISQIDADMGGTEIGAALAAAYTLPCAVDARQDLLLITDGEVWNTESIYQTAAKSGHRIFTVGVGSAVAEAFVRKLAKQTSGACEMVSPGEGMAAKIHRHFKRMTAPAASDVTVAWPGEPVRRFPEKIGPVYAGDTVHLYAWYADVPPAGEVLLNVSARRGTVANRVALEASALPVEKDQMAPSALARVAAATVLTNAPSDTEGAALSVRYQLLSRWANYLVIAQREDKAGELPELRKVPQTLAAGWGGTGSVVAAPACASFDLAPPPSPAAKSTSPRPVAPTERSGVVYRSKATAMECLAEESPEAAEETPLTSGLREWIDYLKSREPHWLAEGDIEVGPSWNEWRLPESLNTVIRDLINSGYELREIILTLLNLLARSSSSDQISRDLTRLIKKAYKDAKSDPMIEQTIRAKLLTLPEWDALAQ